MANQFVNLPALAANGAGAWVDVSSFGGLKTITVAPNGAVFSPFVTIECSNQDTPTIGYPLTTFQQVKDQTFDVACHWMRAVTSNYKGGGAPTVAVGGTDDGTSSDQLPVPVGDGLGTAVDVSALENLKTVQVAGVFGGTVNVLVSEDGGATYNNAFSFQGGPGTAFQTIIVVADFMRVQRVGVPLVAPGQPVVWVSATAGGGGGGGGGGGALTVTDGTTTVTDVTTLTADAPAGMYVTEIAPGNAKIGYVNDTVQEDGSTIVGGTHILNFVGAAVTADTDPDTGFLRANISYSAKFPVTARYTVTGTEPDLTNITINLTSLGIPQPNTNYNSIVTGGGMAFGVSIDTVQANNTTTTINIVGGPWTAGDVLVILIVPFVPV